MAAELTGAPLMPWPVLVLRLMGAVVLCGAVGYEREAHGRAAGLRTHILVGLAAAVYTLIMQDLVGRADQYPDIARTDPIRIIEAVTGGVAFLAAGMIVFSGDKVRGLTTGAGLWLSAAIGLAVGMGLWPLALLSTLLALAVLGMLRLIKPDGPDEDG
ncbi:MgtC/SapB family protein [Mangrovicoccus sp. HB182678]|uniref:Protein MgtC n=2 Tax=Mangrovicoccus algicola TaxID=2771008 RepID=A0A8J7CZB3_9RHOB|nr:MgtC/SapB family protein [Mangrovicoccus algicola]